MRLANEQDRPRSFKVKDVFYVPGAEANLLLMTLLARRGLEVKFSGIMTHIMIGKKSVAVAVLERGLYRMITSVSVITSESIDFSCYQIEEERVQKVALRVHQKSMVMVVSLSQKESRRVEVPRIQEELMSSYSKAEEVAQKIQQVKAKHL